jgi:hypothetical protein
VASNLLKNMFGEKDPFKNPKDVDLSVRILKGLEINGSYARIQVRSATLSNLSG